jgi:DNA-binding transcriptional MerR regulator
MNVFTIKDLENLSGIKAHTIRIWEQRYNFLKPCRTETNIRYYCSEELKTILNISLLNKYGFKISHINRMSDQELRSKIISLTDTGARQERLINDLIAYMIEMNVERLDQVLDNYVQTHGIERAITQIIFPFLHRIGILWITNHIQPAQEHLVSNIIRRKLIVGIESVVSIRQVKQTVLLFLPEGEYHELGLIYVHYLLRTRGARVLYLGADTTLTDVEFVVKHKRPDLLYTHLTSVTGNFSLERFMFQLSQRLPDIPLVISGQVVYGYAKKAPKGVNFKRSLPEVLDFVESLG